MKTAVSSSGLTRQIIICIAAVLSLLVFSPARASAGTNLTLLLTSNLQGRFSPVIEGQNDNDPMLLMAQSIISEREKHGFDIYFDLGNSFYPGPVSRFSYGSVMMDFFSYFNCAATVVSSRDISIGLANLEFLLKGKQTKMLSANITREKRPVFTPSMVVEKDGKKIGFIGVSSSEGMFDIADKQVLKISFSEQLDAVKAEAAGLKGSGCTHIILLSGLSYRNNLELMDRIPELDLTVSGGDSGGNLFSARSSRVDLQWGRSIVTLLKNEDYYLLSLDLDEGIRVKSFEQRNPLHRKTSDNGYREFVNRLTLWKEKFAVEENRLIAEDFPAVRITDERAADMLRHRYRCEIAIIEKYSVLPAELSGLVTSADVMELVNNDYPIFTYRLTGAELATVTGYTESGLVITGIKDGRVQDYRISDTRRYSVCSTQSAYDRVSRILRKRIDFENSWMILKDDIEDDIMSDRSIASRDFDYLDSRFRMLVDITLSNFYDKSDVSRGGTIDTPPGKPEETYTRWGLEDTLNITLYNRYHQLVLTPYIYFIKQDDEYNQNLLRGTLLYSYNLNRYVKPYHKSQGDTVLVEDDGRPVLIRETVGALIESEMVTGKIGAGFEKEVQDPEEKALYGLETIIDATIPFSDHISYVFKLDSFVSLSGSSSDDFEARSEITNALSFRINSMLSFSTKYKWFYLYSDELDESYRYSQLLLSLDLRADFKFF